MRAGKLKDKVWLQDGYGVEHEYHVHWYNCPAEPDVGLDTCYIEIDEITNPFGEPITVTKERFIEILDTLEMRMGG